jgi:hypothetical protein
MAIHFRGLQTSEETSKTPTHTPVKKIGDSSKAGKEPDSLVTEKGFTAVRSGEEKISAVG